MKPSMLAKRRLTYAVIVMAMTKPAHGQGIPECTVQADPSVRLACYDKL